MNFIMTCFTTEICFLFIAFICSAYDLGSAFFQLRIWCISILLHTLHIERLVPNELLLVLFFHFTNSSGSKGRSLILNVLFSFFFRVVGKANERFYPFSFVIVKFLPYRFLTWAVFSLRFLAIVYISEYFRMYMMLCSLLKLSTNE